jgi:hypothetical protein
VIDVSVEAARSLVGVVGLVGGVAAANLTESLKDEYPTAFYAMNLKE